jgi:hypothetical protein
VRFCRAFSTPRLTALLLVLPAAWAKSPSPKTMDLPPPLQITRSLSAEELLTATQKLLPKGAFLGPLLDTRYAVIKHEWLARKFVPFYRDSVAMIRDAANGNEEGADCDDFGMYLRHMIGIAGMLAGTAQPAAAKVIAFQEKSFSGVGRTRERHAIGLFLTDEGWFVLEPQNPSALVALLSYPNHDRLQYITYH